MRSLLFLTIFAVYLTSCSNQPAGNSAALKQLKQRKYTTDSLISDQSLIVFARVKGKTDLVPVKNKRFPPDIEATFNVLKNKDGKVIYVAELPFNAENDYFIAYKNYFDEAGKLYVFQRLNNFFGSGCTKGAAVENLINYYSSDFKLIDSVYTLTDTNKKELDKAGCKFPYNFPYTVYRTIADYRKEKDIEAF